jgi:hypothetical protein
VRRRHHVLLRSRLVVVIGGDGSRRRRRRRPPSTGSSRLVVIVIVVTIGSNDGAVLRGVSISTFVFVRIVRPRRRGVSAIAVASSLVGGHMMIDDWMLDANDHDGSRFVLSIDAGGGCFAAE